MPLKNRYARRAKISEKTFRELLSLFALERDASRIAETLAVSRNTVNAYLRKIRMRLAEHALEGFPLFHELEYGESIFHVLDARRCRRDIAAASVLVGIVRKDKTVFIEVQPGRDKKAYRMFMRGRMFVEGTTNMECWKDYVGRIDLDLDAGENEGSVGVPGSHPQMATVHSFVSFARERLLKFRGVKENSIRLHLKECEFRFNMHNLSIYSAIRQILRNNPLD